MLGPYKANYDRTISYRGNNIFSPIKNIKSVKVKDQNLQNRAESLNEEYWLRTL